MGNNFPSAFALLMQTFEVIALGFHIGEYPDWTQWDQESRTRASTLIASMGNFQLITTLTIMVNILDIIKGAYNKNSRTFLGLVRCGQTGGGSEVAFNVRERLSKPCNV